MHESRRNISLLPLQGWSAHSSDFNQNADGQRTEGAFHLASKGKEEKLWKQVYAIYRSESDNGRVGGTWATLDQCAGMVWTSTMVKDHALSLVSKCRAPTSFASTDLPITWAFLTDLCIPLDSAWKIAILTPLCSFGVLFLRRGEWVWKTSTHRLTKFQETAWYLSEHIWQSLLWFAKHSLRNSLVYSGS